MGTKNGGLREEGNSFDRYRPPQRKVERLWRKVGGGKRVTWVLYKMLKFLSTQN